MYASRSGRARTILISQCRMMVAVLPFGIERGLGLLGMQERVTHLDGTFHLQSEIGRGTVIAIRSAIKPATSFQNANESSSDLAR